jgi:CheY-like chemotaxis protein
LRVFYLDKKASLLFVREYSTGNNRPIMLGFGCRIVSQTESAAARESPRNVAKLNGVRILVVDDQEDARELVTTILEREGAVVSQADSVSGAMQVMAHLPFALLVSDIGMPIEDGYELIRQVRSAASLQLREMPAVAVTAFCTPQDRTKACSAGFQEHLAKPVDMRSLVEVAARLTGLSAPSGTRP